MNLSELADLVNELEEGLGRNRINYKEAWSLIKDINLGFKSLGRVDQQNRNALWSNFQRQVTLLKSSQSEYLQLKKGREEISAAIVQEIEAIIYFNSYDTALHDNPIFLQTEWQLNDSGTPYNLQLCSDQIKEAWGIFNSRKHEMTHEDKQGIFGALRNVQEKLNEWWSFWRESKQEKWVAIREARREKKEEQIANLNERIEKLEGVLERKETHLEALREKLAEAREGSDYESRVEGWIEEEEAAISDIEEKLDKLRGWKEEAEQYIHTLD